MSGDVIAEARLRDVFREDVLQGYMEERHRGSPDLSEVAEEDLNQRVESDVERALGAARNAVGRDLSNPNAMFAIRDAFRGNKVVLPVLSAYRRTYLAEASWPEPGELTVRVVDWKNETAPVLG